MPPDSEPMNMKDLICNCVSETQHKVNFVVNVIFHENTIVPPFAEKMIGMILFKIFNRLKQFIENITLY